MPTPRRALLFLLGAWAALACMSHASAGFSPSAPPSPPAEELPFQRVEGKVWIEGFWSLSDAGWSWVQGHHAPAEPGKVFRQGFWERRDDGYHWVSGAWLSERMDHVWVRGHWKREGVELVWISGGWLPTRRGYVWIPGGWARTGTRDRWVEGYWSERPQSRLPPRADVEPARRDAGAATRPD